MDSKKLLNSFFQCAELNSLTEAVCNEMKCSVIVVDDAFRIVSSFADDTFDNPVYKRAVSDMELSLPEADPDIALIVDGKINKTGLLHLKKDEEWLKNAVSPHLPDGILLFTCNNAGDKTVIPKEAKS